MSDNDLIRRGDAIAACQDIISAVEMESIPAAPAPTLAAALALPEIAALVDAAEALAKQASKTSSLGAMTGPHWTHLSIATLTTRAALAAIEVTP